jgi:nucleoside-diphosphate-sugar epimerase
VQVEAEIDADVLRRILLIHRPEAVIHLAAVPAPFTAPDDVTFVTNTSLALWVLAAATETGVGSVLFASSPTVVGYGAPTGWVPTRLPISETHPLEPWTAYAVSKVAVENLVQATVRAGTSMRLGVFRPCFVIAPEEWAGAPPQQGPTVAQRLAAPTLAAVARFNYLDARDAGAFVCAWLAHAAAIPNGETFFVGAADSLVREPVGIALAREVPGTAVPAAGLSADAAVFSSAKAQRLLGWQAQRSWRTELVVPGPPADAVAVDAAGVEGTLVRESEPVPVLGDVVAVGGVTRG